MAEFWNVVITILITILVFGVIIFIHELGHFTAAKASGIKVHEFALGMGPTLFHFTKGDTKYAIRLLPIGGFVQMEGEDGESEDEYAFSKKPVWKRIIVVVAGACMNILLGFLILIGTTAAMEKIPTKVVGGFRTEASAVETSGLQIGDEILKINGRTMFIEQDIAFSVNQDADKIVEMVVRRNGKKVTLPSVDVSFVQRESEDGSTAEYFPFFVTSEDKNVFSVLKYAALDTLYVGRVVWLSLLDLFKGAAKVTDLAGPIGVGQVIGQARFMGLDTLFTMIAFITINIGVFNLLPIPALDGARLVFLLIEAVRRKPINPKYEGYVHAAGVILLLLLMAFVAVNDVLRFFR